MLHNMTNSIIAAAIAALSLAGGASRAARTSVEHCSFANNPARYRILAASSVGPASDRTGPLPSRALLAWLRPGRLLLSKTHRHHERHRGKAASYSLIDRLPKPAPAFAAD
jgi:hypothetical protein